MPNWPHAPSRNFSGAGTYMVTAATYHKVKFFDSAEKLDLLHNMLLSHLSDYGWEVRAWAVFPNHYHFVAYNASPDHKLMQMLSKLHTQSAEAVNKMDNEPGRQIWYRSWPTKLTFERSYFARLSYVYHNPVKHKIVEQPRLYRWCSAAWFDTNADPIMRKTVMSFKHDKVNIDDDY